MSTALDRRIAKLEAVSKASQPTRVFSCTVRGGREAEDRRAAFNVLGQAPGSDDMVFVTIYERRPGSDPLPGVTPHAAVLNGW